MSLLLPAVAIAMRLSTPVLAGLQPGRWGGGGVMGGSLTDHMYAQHMMLLICAVAPAMYVIALQISMYRPACKCCFKGQTPP